MRPDRAIFCTLGNHSKPVATIFLPKLPTLLGNFCKCVKIYHFSSEIIFRQLLSTFGDFLLVTLKRSRNILRALFLPYSNICLLHRLLQRPLYEAPFLLVKRSHMTWNIQTALIVRCLLYWFLPRPLYEALTL